MPQQANFTVKNAANADVVFRAMSPASGDGSWAQYRATGSTPALSPVLRVKSQFNGKRDARRVEMTAAVPITAIVGGVDTLMAVVPLNLSTTLPLNVTEAAVTDAVVTMLNSFAIAQIRDQLTSGYAAT